ncbi:MAG: glucosyl transferase [Cyanobium sp.]|uniref:glycosyltransferase n=1 Tax=Synechococcus sp. CS-1333 TaxID=2848638 RepID=UPI000DBBE898|nr:glycosyltransferase [Synechococcus sp. CS-1333]MCT0211209.1 glucosyl transferase [Synechococcus sp. CS-1333]PZV22959.1 MAG: glucosyl transferase [Cyanobium sp.]
MILVSVGTEQFPFNRLMQWVELLIQHELIDEEIVVQYGTCTFLPSGTTVYRLLKEESFGALVQRARVVIAHCGEGTVLLLDEMQQPFILVPRSVRYQEHVDDHQVELALALTKMGVPIAWSPGDLVRFLLAPFKTSISDVTDSSAQSLCRSLQSHFSPA